MRFDYLTIEDIKDYVSKNQTIVIPFGSIEAHAKHLPIASDTIIIKWILGQLNILHIPILYYTPVNFAREQNLELFGTINFDQGIWISFVEDILKSLYKKKFRKFIFLTWHDTSRFTTCLKKIKNKKEYNIEIIRTWPLSIKLCKKNQIYVPPKERHAAHIETSIIMFLRPDLIKKGKIVKGEYEEGLQPRSLDGSGVYGDATKASPEIGKKILNLIINEVKKRTHTN